ncbi:MULTISPECIES: BspA family leucine-rich repeat surface protein [unclassified Butyrivibrio]|uniref:BspA family leucine-rich repeat surface protein n=1 Tax=unclassified Butyrivibrio TaxID=2639466 RepID=UPI0003B4681C|nr:MULTISPECIES: BspA family leucine-rich repeat surface protein [unclassified Butyrivibrio]
MTSSVKKVILALSMMVAVFAIVVFGGFFSLSASATGDLLPATYDNRSHAYYKVDSQGKLWVWGENIDASSHGLIYDIPEGIRANIIEVDVTGSFEKFYADCFVPNSRVGTAKFHDCDISKITNLSGAFDGVCATNIYLENFDTSNATDMTYMFRGCQATAIHFGRGFNTSSVQNMICMFQDCRHVKNLDITCFDTSNVENMAYMFEHCDVLESIKLGSNFNTSNVTSMGHMFENCKALTSLDVSRFDTSNVEDMNAMFWLCSSLTDIDVSGFNTSKVKWAGGMFASCERLTSIDVSHFDTANMDGFTFYGCSSLRSVNLSNWIISYVSFQNCDSLQEFWSPKMLGRAISKVELGGKFFMDDNNDGKPDDGKIIDSIEPQTGSHHYVRYNPQAGSSGSAQDDSAEDTSDDISYTQTKWEIPDMPSLQDENVKNASNPYVGKKFENGDFTYYINGNTTVTILGTKNKSIKKLKIPKTVEYLGDKYTVTRIGTGAFKDLKYLKSVKIPSTIEELGEKAFYHCYRLKKMTIQANPSLTIGTKAVDEVHKNCVIKVKGLKKNEKKTLIKKIKKQTNAKVK